MSKDIIYDMTLRGIALHGQIRKKFRKQAIIKAIALNKGKAIVGLSLFLTISLVATGVFTGFFTANSAVAKTIITYTITPSLIGSGGTISPPTPQTVNSGGDSVPFTITPNAGYIVLDVSVDSVPEGRINSRTFTNVTTNHTISASFENGWKAPNNSPYHHDASHISDAYVSDDSYTKFTDDSDWVSYNNLALNIPSGVTINGITIAAEAHKNFNGSRTLDISLSSDGGTSFIGPINSGDFVRYIDTTKIIGDSSNLWGRAWSASDFSDPNFIIKISRPNGKGGSVDLDQIQVKVYYTSCTSTIWYRDADSDTYGNLAITNSACAQPAGYVNNSADCDDTDSSINPSASDSNCDGVDNNCDGQADEGYVPTDTSCGLGVCVATGQDVCVAGQIQNTCIEGQPVGTDNDCNGIDEDCSGIADDNYIPDISCFLPGLCAAENVASSCNAGVETACAPGTPQTEICDADKVDENCDGSPNEGCECNEGQTDSCYVGSEGTEGVGICQSGTQTCDINGVWGSCDGYVYPATEACDRIDNNCDGTVDDGFDVGSSCSSSANSCGDTNQGLLKCSEDGFGTICSAETPAERDCIPPEIIKAETQDVNNDGKIDAIKLTFSEPINDDRLVLLGPDGWDVDGYSGESIGTGDVAYDEILLLSFAQGIDPDTADTPTISYIPQFLNSTHDMAGNQLETVLNYKTTDGAKPVILSAKTKTTTTIEATFSEDLQGDQLTTDDFAVDNRGIPMTILSVSEENGVVTSTISETMATDSTPTVMINPGVPASIKDLAGNEQTAQQSVVAADGIAPTLTEKTAVSASTKDTTPDYTFASTEGGAIVYSGDCSSAIVAAIAGDNTITFNELVEGAHNNCTIKVTDTASNESALLAITSFIVDTTAPVITVPDDITTSTTDSTGTTVTYAAPTAIDAVDGSVVATCDKNSGDNFPIGTTIVNCSAADAATNTATKTFNVTVNLTEPQVAISGGGGGGGGGGGAPAEPTLIISDLTSPSVTTDSLTLTWTTNFVSSSYVIYSAEGETHSLDMLDNTGIPPTYGYAHATPELDTDPKVTNHLVMLTGLNPLTTYYFRVVSRGSLAVGGEYKITTPAVAGAQIAIGTIGGETVGSGTTGGEVMGGETIEQSGEVVVPQIEEVQGTQSVSLPTTEKTNPTSTNPNPFVAGFVSVTSRYFWPLLIIFIVLCAGYGIYYLVKRKNK